METVNHVNTGSRWIMDISWLRWLRTAMMCFKMRQKGGPWSRQSKADLVPQSPTCLSSAWRRSYEERSSARAWKGRVFPVDDNSSHWAIWCYNYAICLKKLMFCVLGIFGACHEGLNGAMSLFYRFLGHLWFPFPVPIYWRSTHSETGLPGRSTAVSTGI